METNMEFEAPEYQRGFAEPQPPKPTGRLKKAVNKILNSLRLHALKYFLAALAISLLVSAVIVALTPTLPEEVPVPLGPISAGVVEAPRGVKVSFQNPDQEFPAALAIYQFSSPLKKAEQLANAMADQKQIPKDPSPYVENLWTNFETGEQIVVQPQFGKIIFNTYETETPEEGNFDTSPFNTSSAIEAAKKFLSNIEDYAGAEAINSGIGYLTDEDDVETGAEAQLMIIPFTFKLNSYPLYFSGARDSYATLYIDKEYQVKKAEFFPPPPQTQEVGMKNIISLDEAAEQIAAGKAVPIAAGSRTGQFSVSEIRDLRITEATLEYRLNTEKQLVIPYFRFEAVGTTNRQDAEDGPTHLTLLLPAIPTIDPESIN